MVDENANMDVKTEDSQMESDMESDMESAMESEMEDEWFYLIELIIFFKHFTYIAGIQSRLPLLAFYLLHTKADSYNDAKPINVKCAKTS